MRGKQLFSLLPRLEQRLGGLCWLCCADVRGMLHATLGASSAELICRGLEPGLVQGWEVLGSALAHPLPAFCGNLQTWAEVSKEGRDQISPGRTAGQRPSNAGTLGKDFNLSTPKIPFPCMLAMRAGFIQHLTSSGIELSAFGDTEVTPNAAPWLCQCGSVLCQPGLVAAVCWCHWPC